MKTQITAIDLHYLIGEMQYLVDSKIDKIYNPKKEDIIFQLHVTGKGRELIRIIAGKFMFISELKEVFEEPSGFCMFLRKRLGSARIRKITQICSERIALIEFENSEGVFRLYSELFGKGNIILTDDKDIIINALEQKKWADRTIMKGEKYSYPKKEFNLFELKKDEFKKIIDSKSQDTEIVYSLAKDLGMGGTYAEELCAIAKIDKSKKKITSDDKEDLYSAFKKIMSAKPSAVITYEDKKIKDVLPFDFKSTSETEKKNFESFNKAFDFFFGENIFTKIEFVSKHDAAIKKAENIIGQQKRQIAELENAADDNSKKAEKIYENYQLVTEILTEINKARQKYSFDEIKQKIKGHKTIKDIDGKSKKVVVEL